MIPLYLTSEGDFQENSGNELLKELLIHHLKFDEISDFNTIEEDFKKFPIIDILNVKKEEIEKISLKEIDLIKNQRDFNVLTKYNHLINKKNKEMTQVDNKINDLEVKLKRNGILNEKDKTTLKGRRTRKKNLDLDIRFLKNKKMTERRKIKEV